MLPPGFDYLFSVGSDDSDDEREENDAYYRIERDGSASIIANRSKRILSATLSDGSRISGGVNQAGFLFGDRIVPMPEGTLRRYPLRWHESGAGVSIEPSVPIDEALQPSIESAPKAKTPRKQPGSLVDSDTLVALREAAATLESYRERQDQLEAENAELRTLVEALTVQVEAIKITK